MLLMGGEGFDKNPQIVISTELLQFVSLVSSFGKHRVSPIARITVFASTPHYVVLTGQCGETPVLHLRGQ